MRSQGIVPGKSLGHGSGSDAVPEKEEALSALHVLKQAAFFEFIFHAAVHFVFMAEDTCPCQMRTNN